MRRCQARVTLGVFMVLAIDGYGYGWVWLHMGMGMAMAGVGDATAAHNWGLSVMGSCGRQLAGWHWPYIRGEGIRTLQALSCRVLWRSAKCRV